MVREKRSLLAGAEAQIREARWYAGKKPRSVVLVRQCDRGWPTGVASHKAGRPAPSSVVFGEHGKRATAVGTDRRVSRSGAGA